ncbi:Clan S-, family S54, Rhomboid-like serine peptidase [Histomonas meleagridis]|uniref:Clan S, family S54, Rhomboid-like serine peptidase n=1 Tax=Histomonas meleagridis TaxID=135588 RepID=UPI00355AC41D|nr:Clan S-, family S54, Rhomboid-like serine peptidase [Histomonas meleagridis]KAH0798817.1 Clan S, family S54, Rhomboid-like serine peptidase [Histomonas meleagridis]
MTYQISEETANLINSSVNIDGTLDEKIRAAFDDLMHAQELGETTLQLVDAYNKTVEDSKKELEEKRRMYGAITAAAIDELQNAYNQPQSSPFPVNNITNKIKQADEGFTRALSDFSNNVNSKLYQANEHFAQISNKIKIAIQSKSKQSVDTSQFDPVCQYFKCTIQEIPNIMGKLYQANQNFESFVKQLSEKLHCTYDEVPNTLNQKLTIFESLLQTLNTEEPNAKNKLETTTSVINQLTTMFNTNETDLIPTISNLISEKQNNNNETNEAQLKQLKTSAIQLQKERDELQQQLQIITNQLQHNRNNITYQRFDHLIDIIPLNINMNIENAPNKDETIWKLQNELNKLLESLNTIQETKNNQIKSLTNQLEQTELNKISAETEKQNLEIEMQKLKMQISNNNYKNVIDNLMYTLNSIAAFMKLGGEPSEFQSHALGFSGILFALIVIDIYIEGGPYRSFFSLFLIPSYLYPWVMLLFMQLILGNVSFLGHLSGLLVGYLYQFGIVKILTPPKSAFLWLENRICHCCIDRLGYVPVEGVRNFVYRPYAVFQHTWGDEEEENNNNNGNQQNNNNNNAFTGQPHTIGDANTDTNGMNNNVDDLNIEDDDGLENLEIGGSDRDSPK